MEPASLLLLTLLLTQDDGEALSRITNALPCEGPAGEIIVCGRRRIDEPYRIPAQLRERPLESRNYSWAARARDEREAARYSGPPVGAGSFARSRQTECEWRAERQEIAGLMIDCTQRRTTAE